MELKQTEGDVRNSNGFSDPNFIKNRNKPVHRWVPWIAGYSSDFVDSAIEKYLPENEKRLILDPFCGVGTTLLSASEKGHDAIGFEINPYAALASKAKTEAYEIDPDILSLEIIRFNTFFDNATRLGSKPKSKEPNGFKTRAQFYSPSVLRKVLLVKDFLSTVNDPLVLDLFKLAFGATLVKYSNYSYEPSLGQRESAGKSKIFDYDVRGELSQKLDTMLKDIIKLRKNVGDKTIGSCKIIQDSFFEYKKYIAPESVDLLITSPPYMNNYHYIRNTRPQLYWLDFVHASSELKPLEDGNFGKYWQTVRQAKKIELLFKTESGNIESCIEKIRTSNHRKGYYGGSGWANYVTTYLNDCYRFAQAMKYCLRPGGTGLIVIGNNVIQGVHVPTDVFLGIICDLVGLQTIEIHIPRLKRTGNSIIRSNVRAGTVSKAAQLYEAVVEVTTKKN